MLFSDYIAIRLNDSGTPRTFKLFLCEGINYNIDIVKNNKIISTTHVNLERAAVVAAAGVNGNVREETAASVSGRINVRADSELLRPSTSETSSFATDRVAHMIEMCGFVGTVGLVDNDSGRVIDLVDSDSNSVSDLTESV